MTKTEYRASREQVEIAAANYRDYGHASAYKRIYFNPGKRACWQAAISHEGSIGHYCYATEAEAVQAVIMLTSKPPERRIKDPNRYARLEALGKLPEFAKEA